MKLTGLKNELKFNKREADSLNKVNDQRRIMNNITSSYFNTGIETLDRRSAFLKVAVNKRRK
ncbi:hypothetical protein [Carnobacterium jeotgali]|uniref:hypothetical protein n=1 Tax=Carnobacterium jeotgali TaxID=545534 RepID=UPI003890F126